MGFVGVFIFVENNQMKTPEFLEITFLITEELDGELAQDIDVISSEI